MYDAAAILWITPAMYAIRARPRTLKNKDRRQRVRIRANPFD